MKKVHVYSHTHWDYEWYFTANETIIQLIYHMDEVIEALESGKVNKYLLDGQISILEEYIKFMPDRFEVVKKLVTEGKLLIGPWYTQTDELIISGESIIRNLFYGIKNSSKYGDYMKIGYLPDSFGQTKDLPKILNGFDIQRSIFWRGVSKDECPNREFIWNSEDGSSVLVYNIKDGYYYGGNLIYNDDVKSVEEKMRDGSATQNILLPVGGDQRYVDFNIKERIKYYQDRTENNFKYIESSCDEFFDELEKEKNLLQVEGEFINPSNSKIHRSIYSSRYDHKYLNDKIERRLVYVLEPLMVMAQNIGLDPKVSMLEEIWKKLLMNHAHDSACGCNSDKTNDSILARLIEVDQLSYSACDYIVRKISESIKDREENDLILFNTLSRTRDEAFTINITSKNKDFKIIDEEGVEIPLQIIESKKEYSGSIKRSAEEHDENLYFYVTKAVIKCKVNPFSIKRLKVIEEKSNYSKEEILENVIEDNYYKVEFNNGKIDITNKLTGEVLKDYISIEDSGDDGDTYDYSPPYNDIRFKFDFKDSKCRTINGALYKELNISGVFNVPKNLEDRNISRINSSILYTMKLSLNNKKIIDCHLEINNNAEDHRMRVIIRTGVTSNKSITDTPMGIIKRDNTPNHIDDWRELNWKEEPSPIYPMLHFVSLNDTKSSATIMTKGIKEYEILDNSNIALTLFRGVGYLGKPDLIRRPGVASGNEFKYIETPKSQLKGKLKFKFAINFDKELDITKIKNIFENYSISSPYYQIQEINRFTNTLKYFVSHPLQDDISIIDSLINSDELKGINITSINAIDKKSFIIRFLNSSDKEINDSGKIKVKNAKSYQLVNLNNRELTEEVNVDKEEILMPSFKKGEIKTIKINL
ncbi:glycoside hydrolase family 38 C-terminal domain-containing protein [Clostridium sardiniense]|uniref:glycoside hydrolase family 38 N-terminal domain-containing protein n=1 Tax=Clostridium sardiniense TaxID=29369 RepID=UPI0019590C0B|nr:glycoside hydrolase family 38 C-terminal domain-containing protein [Clostridium sardiniense]MBM7834734.1 mannosylglycerate hydrolase [Clostridium sardiniense]